MTRSYFTEEQQLLLSNNINVAKVSSKTISYTNEFKLLAISKYKQGMAPSQIFIEADLNLNIIGSENPRRCLQRWRNIMSKEGTSGFKGERRGRGGTGRPRTAHLSAEERLIEAEAKIAYLQMENELLKKLDKLERGLTK